jgi:uncharacterized protein (TIGR03084 family)
MPYGQQGEVCVDMTTICADLKHELEALDAIVSPLDEADWNRLTPAEGWTIRDQIIHIGGTDRSAAVAVAEPERFKAEFLHADRHERIKRIEMETASLHGPELLAWWRNGYRTLRGLFLQLDARTRIPWFGPPMSALSFATARLMETWAHGQDIVDALDIDRPGTERLRHIAHIGVLARPFSYHVNHMTMPDVAIRVELVSPSGLCWSWGDLEASNRVSGHALDFCLVVTQRRHLADTALRVAGPAAQEWLTIAQTFAGPPGSGRQPGQFIKKR